MTPELESEGLKREIVRAVNNLRKEKGLTINDRINLAWYSDDELVKKTMETYTEEIKNDTLSSELLNEKQNDSQEQKLNNKIIYLLIK
jgi:isoleucyl-tRNA synthetase